MFDIAWTEMLVLAIIIIVVVGPRDLPKVMRAIGGFMRKARALAGQFQSDMDQLAREAEIDDLRKQARAYQDKFRQPMREFDKLVDPTTGERVEPKPSGSEDAATPPPPEDETTVQATEAAAKDSPKTGVGEQGAASEAEESEAGRG